MEVSGSLPDGVPTDRGILAAMEALLRIYEAPLFPDLPPLQSGLVGYVGYDVVREVENLPDAPPDARKLPDAVVNVIFLSLLSFPPKTSSAFNLCAKCSAV